MLPLQPHTFVSHHVAPALRQQGTSRPPHVLLCVEDVSTVHLLCVVLETIGWQTSTSTLFEWLEGKALPVTPDVMVLCTWPLHYAPIARQALARLDHCDVPLVLFLDNDADRALGPIFHAARTISPHCSLDELIECFQGALHAHPVSACHPRLLIVEDYEPLRQLLQRALSAEFDVIGTAADGATAVHVEAALHPDLIVMDYHMPMYDGIEAARRIKQQPHPPKIVLFTSEDPSEVQLMAQTAGIDAVVQKNGSFKELEQTLIHVSSNSGMVHVA